MQTRDDRHLAGAAHWRAFALRVPLAIGEQGIASVASLAIALALLHHGSLAEFGRFALGNAVVLLALGLHNALVATQLAVRLPAASGHQRARLLAATLRLEGVGAVALLAVAAGALLLGGAGVEAIAGIGLIAGAVAIAIAGGALRDWVRVICYARRREPDALLVSTVGALLYCAGTYVLWSGLGVPAAAAALLAQGFAAGTAAAGWLLVARLPARLRGGSPREFLRATLPHGRWAAAGVLVTHAQTQSALYFAGAGLGVGDAGALSAARLLYSPFALALTGVQRMLLPHWARAGALSAAAVGRAGAAAGCAVAAYSLALWGLREPLGALIAPEAPGRVVILIPWLASVVAAESARAVLSVALQSAQQFACITRASAVAAGVTLAGLAIAVPALGLRGALLATCGGELLLIVLLWRAVRRSGA